MCGGRVGFSLSVVDGSISILLETTDVENVGIDTQTTPLGSLILDILGIE